MSDESFLPPKRDVPIWLNVVDHCFVFQHRCPLNGAFFVSRYISFIPRVVQRMSPSQILRGEPLFALSASLPGPVFAEILRLREDATSHKIELKRRIRAVFTTTTMCRKYSAILHFSPFACLKSDLTSKWGEEPALIWSFMGIKCCENSPFLCGFFTDSASEKLMWVPLISPQKH